MTTIQRHRTTTYEIIQCGECGVDICGPDGYLDRRRQDGQSFYCINGHARAWRETDADRLRKRLAAAHQEQKRLATRAVAAEDQVKAAERERKRQAKRASAGVCPCCKRSFVQLQRHMKGQHPGYAKEKT